MTTRTTVLWRDRLSGKPGGDVYFVPPATITILKSVLITNYDALAQLVILTVTGTNSQAACRLFDQEVPGGTGVLWSGWVVLGTGDHVNVSYNQGIIDTWGSGTHLPAPTA